MKNSFFGKTILMLTCILVFSVNSMAKEKVHRWKLAMTWPMQLAPLSSPPVKFAKLVEQMSDGRLVINIHDANKHKAPFGVLDMVKLGQYQMGHSASYYWKGKDFNTLFFTSVPFGMTMDEQYSWFYYGGGMELMQKVYDKHNVYSYPGGNTGVQMGGWFREEINSLDDLKGIKMRIPGFAGEVMAKLGVVVTNLPPGELYTALERGTIDALEWVGPSMDIKMGFHKVAPYYYTGWHEPASEMQFLINKKAYKRLPKDLQVIVDTAMKAVTADMYFENYAASADAWAKMRKEYPGIKVKEFPLPVLKAMKKANVELLEKFASKDPLTKEIVDSQKAFLKKARKWSEISEYSYLKNMLAVEE